MSYKLRNIIALASIAFILICVGAYFTFYHYPSKINVVEKQLKQIKRNVRDLDDIQEKYFHLDSMLTAQQERLNTFDKNLTRNITSAASYRYLNDIIDRTGFLELNFRFANDKQVGNFGYHVYSFRGEGTFERIFKLIAYLEQGPRPYNIHRLSLRSVEGTDSRTRKAMVVMPFTMEVWAYYADLDKLPEIARGLRNVNPAISSDPFRPTVSRKVPVNAAGLLEVERAELKALVPGKALIADHRGKVHSMKEGDRVFLGRLVQIDNDRGTVVFTLNKGGVIKKFVLTLKMNNY